MTRERKAYLDYLTQALAKDMDGVAVQCIASKYLVQSAKENPQESFRQIMNSFANEDTEQAIASIQSELTKFVAGKTIDTNHATRVVAYVNRFNKNIAKCGVLINGQDCSETMQVKSKRSVPKWYEGREELTKYSATATYKSRSLTFELDYTV